MLKQINFQNTPIVDIVNDILADATKRGASDIHFDPYENHLLIRIRIDGDLIDYADVPNTYKDYLITRIKTISKMNITESRRPQDGAIKGIVQGKELDLRVSALPVSNGEKIVIRILDYSMSLEGVEQLGFSKENYQKLLEMISVPNGIILVTGATGTGKSTTVYSILQRLNTSKTNIITVEDPIEMDIAGINQVQVNSQIGLTFASALRSILRQDPNIIMIGEIRDNETAQIAIRASITGHLVLSTVHTNNSLNTIERLIDMEVPKYLLASALEGIISQKLARQLCPHCRVKRPTTEYEKAIFRASLNKEVDEIWDAKGCEHCHSGYLGRIAIQEVLLINQQIRDALSENVPKEQLREMVYGSGVISLLQDGLNKVVEGLTTLGEIIRLIALDDDDKLGNNIFLKRALENTKLALVEEVNNAQAVNNAPINQAPAPAPTLQTVEAPTMPEVATNTPLNQTPAPAPTLQTTEAPIMPEVATNSINQTTNLAGGEISQETVTTNEPNIPNITIQDSSAPIEPARPVNPYANSQYMPNQYPPNL